MVKKLLVYAALISAVGVAGLMIFAGGSGGSGGRGGGVSLRRPGRSPNRRSVPRLIPGR